MKTSRMLSVLLAVVAVSSCNKKEEARRPEPVPVRTMTVGASADDLSQGYSGTIEEQSGTSLSFAGAGTIQSLSVSEGQWVKQGQLIGTLDPQTMQNSVAVASAATSQAEDALRQAEDAYERMKLLHDNGSLPEIQWVEMQTKLSQAQQMVKQARASEQIARKGLTDTRLTAPFSGYISQKLADAGQNVLPGSPVVQLVKIDQVKVKISVPEEEIAQFSKGQQLKVTVDALSGRSSASSASGGRSFPATVVEKGIAADPLSRSYEVKATIQNPQHELLPGMIARVQYGAVLQRYTGQQLQTQQLITLPASVVQLDFDNRTFVWTVGKGGKAAKTFITTGANAGSSVVVMGGLMAGDRVIIEGQQKVSQGTIVKE